jgi:quinolinate synthase
MEFTTSNVTGVRTRDLVEKIKKVKREKNITLLAHYYQQPEIQDLADYTGDSLGLSQYAASVNAETIAFAGVHFMAETAKILNPNARVLIPDYDAGCSLSESCPPGEFRKFIDDHPDHVVVTYINCAAEIKAMSDIICTSSNAERIINTISADKPVIFAPDRNLGAYLIDKTKRDLVLWNGVCIVHEAFAIDKLLKLHHQFPEARIVAHPESETHLLKVAHFTGSTTGMIRYVKESDAKTFIIATEAGILHAMRKEIQHKTLIPAPSHEDNTCACSECAYMKKNTLEKLLSCMVNEFPVVEIEEPLLSKALVPIQKMLQISKN